MPLSAATGPLYAIKAELFKALAHPVRIQVLEVLSGAPEHAAPVSELLDATGAEASALSQHLTVLKRAGVVTSTRQGNAVVYRLSQPLVAELLVVARAFLTARLAHSAEQLAAAESLPPLPASGAAQTDAPVTGAPATGASE